MSDSLLLNASLGIYILTLFVLISFQIFKKSFLRSVGFITFICGALSNLSALILRGLIADRLPFANTYETLILFAFLMAVLYLFIFRKNDDNKTILMGNIIFMILLIALSSFFSSDPKPLVPALRSNWLAIHVLFCIISYAAFAVASIRAIIYLLTKEYKVPKESYNPIHTIIVIGYTFLALGIVTGSIWGEAAWGSYWNWDPKEVWSLITFLIYTIYLHLKLTGKLSLKILSILVIAAFGLILFTYFGVNYFLTGLHTYA